MVFRLTNKLFKSIKETPPSGQKEAENPFVDWAADHFTVRGSRYIIVTNCASVLTRVYVARGVNDSDRFIKYSLEAVEACLRENGFDLHWERILLPSLKNVYFQKVGDRNMTGILMDLVKNAKFYLSDYYDDLSVKEVSYRLSRIPQLSRKEHFPIEAFKSLEFLKK